MNRLLLGVLLALLLAGCDCGNSPINPGKDGGAGGFSGTGGGGGGAGGAAGGGTGASGGGTALANPLDPNNAFKDTDCDGLSDELEFGTVYAGGLKTDPNNPDTDGDGILDGVEAGHATSVDPRCTAYEGDQDPSTRTNPTVVDSDTDGLSDGQEDANHNGRVDLDETDPASADTDRDGLLDGEEDANLNGVVDPGETNPRLRDTDGDGIADGVELLTTLTDPLLADTDGDTCVDGAEDFNQNGMVDPGETNPNDPSDCGPAVNPDTDGDGVPNHREDANGNGVVDPGEMDPNNPDTDGDGLLDGIEDANHNGRRDPGETNALRIDSDCDGLADGVEDANHNGVVDPGETDPRLFDTDGDGLSDGVELGLQTAGIADPVNCPNVPVDLDPSTTTNPTNRDSDGDGIDDGAEDTDQNGRVDEGELNPNDGSDATLPDGGVSPAAHVCTVANLRPVLFRAQGDVDLQLGLPATFTEVANATTGGLDRGLIGYDPTNQVTFIAWREAARGGATTPTADEAQLRPLLNAQGALSNITTQTFTSWDNTPALQAFYESAAAGDLKTVTNGIAGSLVGAGAGSLTGTAGVTGPFKVQVEYLHRSNQSVVVIVALTPLANYDGAPLFAMSDTAGGSGLAQFGDGRPYQCEVFPPKAGLIDFIVSVDDSGSMDDYQQALANTATAIRDQLQNSQIDWRIALVTSSYASGSSSTTTNANALRGFTTDIDQFRSWLTQDSTCSSGVCTNVPGASPACSGVGRNGGCWVDTNGSGTERIGASAARAVHVLSPATVVPQANRFRAGAQVVVILLGDADDQSTHQTQTNAQVRTNLINFFTTGGSFTHYANDANRTYTNNIGPMAVHGIICPDGETCGGETQRNPRVAAGIITATGGVRGDVGNASSIANSVQQIISSAIAAAGHIMHKPPIGASVKIAMDSVEDGALCNKDNIPRSRVNGFDFDGIHRSISFFGACRPGATASNAAVSYRYWVDYTPDPNGTPPPCEDDDAYDPNAPGLCSGNLECNPDTGACECPSNCGSASPPLGRVCDPNPLVCDFVCTSDCGGACNPYQTCNSGSCECECRENATCAPGFTFMNNGSVCGCVCDVAALGCGPTYQADANSCSCVCAPNCGNTCGAGKTCNASTCQCTSGIN